MKVSISSGGDLPVSQVMTTCTGCVWSFNESYFVAYFSFHCTNNASSWWELVKYGITELWNNEISKTYHLQIVQMVTCSIAIILYLHLATALHGAPRRWIAKQQLGEH